MKKDKKDSIILNLERLLVGSTVLTGTLILFYEIGKAITLMRNGFYYSGLLIGIFFFLLMAHSIGEIFVSE